MIAVALLLLQCSCADVRPLLLPAPKSMEFGKEVISINTCIELTSTRSNDGFVESLKKIYKQQLFRNRVNLNFGSQCEATITFEVENEQVMMPIGFNSENEKYTLEIDTQGQISIRSRIIK